MTPSTLPNGSTTAAVTNPASQRGLVVADAELDVGRASVWSRPHEVGLHAQELRVPRHGRRQVVGPEVDRAESSQAHSASFLVRCFRGYAIGTCGTSGSSMRRRLRNVGHVGPAAPAPVAAAGTAGPGRRRPPP